MRAWLRWQRLYGTFGSFTFDRIGEVVPAPATVYRFHGGKTVVDRIVRVPSTSDN